MLVLETTVPPPPDIPLPGQSLHVVDEVVQVACHFQQLVVIPATPTVRLKSKSRPCQVPPQVPPRVPPPRHLLKATRTPFLDEANKPSLTVDGVDEIDNLMKLLNALLRLELEAVDGGNSDEEGEEFETQNEAITRTILDRSKAGKDGIDVEEISSGDIAFVIGKSMALNSLPKDILTTTPSVPLD